MPKRMLHLDEELFIKALSRAVEEGDTHFVDGHAPRLHTLIEKMRDCLHELTQLQSRAHQLQNQGRLDHHYATRHSEVA